MNGAPDDSQLGQAREQIPSLPDSEIAAARSDGSIDDPANREVAALSEGLSKDELEERAAMAEHGRSERFRDHFEKIAVFSLWVGALAVAAVGLIWLFHIVAPVDWRWLSNEDVTHVQSIVTTGLLVGIISNHFRKRLG